MTITAQMLHEAFKVAAPDAQAKDWPLISDQSKEQYERMATYLNDQSEETNCSEREYVSEVLRTCVATDFHERLLLGALGLAGEAGEVVDILKKSRFQGHALEPARIKDELGDVLWYLALLCHTLGLTFEEVRAENVAKMHRRYPDGFEVERSVNR